MTQMILRTASLRPDAPAILAPGRPPLCYGDLISLMERVARGLRAAGIGPQDRVGVVLPNGPEMASAFLAVSAAAACAPLNPQYRREDFEFYLRDLRARAVLVSSESPAAASEAARALGVRILPIRTLDCAGAFEIEGAGAAGGFEWPDSNHIALLLHTSGTTSRPKLVPLSAANLAASARNIAASLSLAPSDVCLNIMPLFHIHGLAASLLATLISGGSVVCTGGTYARDFFDWLRDFQPTWYTAVPTMHQAILARAIERRSLVRDSRLRFIRSCSAPLARTLLEELEQSFETPVIEAYGMTEAAHQIASNPLPPGRRKPGSVGLPAGSEVRILSADGELPAPGQSGEVIIRGTNVTSGYEANAEVNQAAFWNGWFRTGDQGWMDEEGYLYLTGRLKEIINRGGEKIAPREIDEALLAHPAVRQAVAFSVPHKQLGEDVGAAVELAPGGQVDEAALRRWAAGRLPAFKVPRVIRVVDQIPKGATGKLQRIGLAEKLGIETLDDNRPAAAAVAPRTELEKRIAAVWSELLPGAAVGVEDRFESLGGDSLLAVRMLAAVSEAEGVPIPYEHFVVERTIAALAAGIERQRSAARAVVPLQPRGTRRPLICLPGHDGVLYGLMRLAEVLGGEQPVWAVSYESLGFSRSVEELAAKSVDQIRLLWPQGPYRLAGVCFGGLVALEAARLLMAAGQEVELLAMVDCLNPAWRRTRSRREILGAYLRQFRIKHAHHSARLAAMGAGDKARYLLSRVGMFFHNHSQNVAAWLGWRRHLPIAARAAMLRYSPASYRGDALLLRVPGRRLDAPLLGWQDVIAGRLEMHDLAFEPGGALAGENCERAAAFLQRRLS